MNVAVTAFWSRASCRVWCRLCRTRCTSASSGSLACLRSATDPSAGADLRRSPHSQLALMLGTHVDCVAIQRVRRALLLNGAALQSFAASALVGLQCSLVLPSRSCIRCAGHRVLTLNMDVPEPWLVEPVKADYDLDNLRLQVHMGSHMCWVRVGTMQFSSLVYGQVWPLCEQGSDGVTLQIIGQDSPGRVIAHRAGRQMRMRVIFQILLSQPSTGRFAVTVPDYKRRVRDRTWGTRRRWRWSSSWRRSC